MPFSHTNLEDLRHLRSMGLAKPEDAPQELWDQAGPYDTASALQVSKNQLEQAIITRASAPLPADDKGRVKHFFEQAIACRVEIMNDPGNKPADRLKASETFIEHTIGKPEQVVNVAGSLALTFHQEQEKLAREIKSGLIIPAQNLLANNTAPVDDFLKSHMPQKYVVGKKVAPREEESTGEVPERSLEGGEDPTT